MYRIKSRCQREDVRKTKRNTCQASSTRGRVRNRIKPLSPAGGRKKTRTHSIEPHHQQADVRKTRTHRIKPHQQEEDVRKTRTRNVSKPAFEVVVRMWRVTTITQRQYFSSKSTLSRTLQVRDKLPSMGHKGDNTKNGEPTVHKQPNAVVHNNSSVIKFELREPSCR